MAVRTRDGWWDGRRLAVAALTAVAMLAHGCGDGSSGTADDGGGAGDGAALPDDGGGGRADGAALGDGGDPGPTVCPVEPLADISGATAVGTEAALRSALAAGGRVRLTADITASAPFPITLPTVLDGDGHTLSGGNATHLLVATMTDLTVQNITLRDARNLVPATQHFSRQSGAAIMVNGGNGTTDGAARGSLKLVRATLLGNRAEMVSNGDIRGGAVYLFNTPNATFSEVTFRANVGVSGGAIGGLGSSLAISNSVFDANQASNAGRAGTLDGTGGAISLDAVSQNKQTAYFRICGATFQDNRAARIGGAIYDVNHWKTGTVVSVEQTTFLGNATTSTTEGQGGAIFVMDDDKYPANTGSANQTRISASLFTDNRTWGQGGGVWYWSSDGSLLVQNTTFQGNRIPDINALGMGGALAVSRGRMTTVAGCTFADNYAKFHGGGIQISGSADAVVTLGNSLFHNNLSNRNGGYANFHTNRAADVDLGGNMQYLAPGMVIDVNSNALVAAGAMRADAQLMPLGQNGGPTRTMALPAGSPARNAGVSTAALPAQARALDQRGFARDGQPDIGAFEVVP